ncbi:MAG: hypothetical protein QM647_13125 [Asticcacaulis sp.]|uniref:hypothetical protein n=1 Tax=Asticcacaulis sp. TaxID=1872648 RepID=UPI0039E586FA
MENTSVTLDLSRLCRERTGDAIRSVMQLCETHDQMLAVSISGLFSAYGNASGTLAGIMGIEASQIEPAEFMAVLLELMAAAKEPEKWDEIVNAGRQALKGGEAR